MPVLLLSREKDVRLLCIFQIECPAVESKSYNMSSSVRAEIID